MLKRLRKNKLEDDNYKCYRCGYESTKEEKYSRLPLVEYVSLHIRDK